MRRLETNCKYLYSLNGKCFFFSLLPCSTYFILHFLGLAFPLFLLSMSPHAGSLFCMLPSPHSSSVVTPLCRLLMQALYCYLLLNRPRRQRPADLGLNQLYHTESVWLQAGCWSSLSLADGECSKMAVKKNKAKASFSPSSSSMCCVILPGFMWALWLFSCVFVCVLFPHLDCMRLWELAFFDIILWYYWIP